MAEYQLFEPGTIPAYTTPEWYAGRERAPHLEQDLHRPRLLEAARQVNAAAIEYGLTSLVDLGAGDGGLLQLLQQDACPPWPQGAWCAWGYDLQPSNVAGALDRGVDVRLGDSVKGVTQFGLTLQWGQIAVATEMLEHLVDPHHFVRDIGEHCHVLVASSPWNEHPGAAYEFHLWSWDHDGYRALLEQGGFTVVRHETVGMFQVATAVKS